METSLLYPSCLRPLCFLGDLRNLATRWLGRLAELGGLAGWGRLCRLRGLCRRGRLCRLRGLRGLTFRGALELGRRQKDSQHLLHASPCSLTSSMAQREALSHGLCT